MQRIFLASDHGGFTAKQLLVDSLRPDFQVTDLGPASLDPTDDYPIYAEKVARHVVAHPGSLGVLLCRSGEGMEIAANKVPGIRAAVAWNEQVARESRHDNDSNVLSVPADQLSEPQIENLVRTWLTTPFSNAERHARRIEQIKRLEQEAL